jgi:hypothetical protein
MLARLRILSLLLVAICFFHPVSAVKFELVAERYPRASKPLHVRGVT